MVSCRRKTEKGRASFTPSWRRLQRRPELEGEKSVGRAGDGAEECPGNANVEAERWGIVAPPPGTGRTQVGRDLELNAIEEDIKELGTQHNSSFIIVVSGALESVVSEKMLPRVPAVPPSGEGVTSVMATMPNQGGNAGACSTCSLLTLRMHSWASPAFATQAAVIVREDGGGIAHVVSGRQIKFCHVDNVHRLTVNLRWESTGFPGRGRQSIGGRLGSP